MERLKYYPITEHQEVIKMDLFNPIERMTEMRKNHVKKRNNQNLYRIATYEKSKMKERITGEIGYDYFRDFIPIKPESGRKINDDDLLKALNTTKFDIYLDTIFDYPQIIQKKLEGKVDSNWKKYNYILTMQVSPCSFMCWFCYVDRALREGKIGTWISSEELLKSFLKERDKFHEKGEIQKGNVLRISGGEPFIAPELHYECLNMLEEMGLDKKIFVWTETNISPFFQDQTNGHMYVENWIDLQELNNFNNYVIHPCLHGVNESNLSENSQIEGKYVHKLFDGIERMIELHFDIYPTFGSNLTPPNSVEELFDKLHEINGNLPIRIALIDFKFYYSQVLSRMKNDVGSFMKEKIYTKEFVINKWDELMKRKYGKGYGEFLRYEVDLW